MGWMGGIRMRRMWMRWMRMWWMRWMRLQVAALVRTMAADLQQGSWFHFIFAFCGTRRHAKAPSGKQDAQGHLHEWSKFKKP